MREQIFSGKLFSILASLSLLLVSGEVIAADRAPDWMQSLKNAPVPAHKDKDDAVCLYSEQVLTVKSDGKMTRFLRQAYKILRPDSPRTMVRIPFDEQTKITDMRAWSIPAQGKDYAVKARDAVEVAAGDGSTLVSDSKVKVLAIPAAEPGAVIGYEVEQEVRPYFQEDSWMPQENIAVSMATYTLQLPRGWAYKATWRNGVGIEPGNIGEGRWQWTMRDLQAVRMEEDMPPINSLAQELIIRFVPPEGQGRVLESWREMGNWYLALTENRHSATPEIKRHVNQLIASQTTMQGKIRTLSEFAQGDIRYVAIALGIGGLQPHFANDIFNNRYGDCKDKVTLLIAMLKEIGVDSHYVIVNNEHDVVPIGAPPSVSLFNHAIIAIQLPAELKEWSAPAVVKHAALGGTAYFDPTNEFVPFGELPGYLQGNNAMLVRKDGTELIKLPVQPAATNGVTRIAKLTLSEKGAVSGEVVEDLIGQLSFESRLRLQRGSMDVERAKFIERKLANSLSSFRVIEFKVNNQSDIYRPLEYKYSFEAEKYAKLTGDMLIVRPRVLGSKSSALLETDEKRENPVQFVSLQKDTDEFAIALPAGYVPDDLPPPTDLDYPFGSYHSKTTVTGNTLKYVRTFEIKQFTVPVDKLDDLKSFYRQIYRDERANAVLIKK